MEKDIIKILMLSVDIIYLVIFTIMATFLVKNKELFYVKDPIKKSGQPKVENQNGLGISKIRKNREIGSKKKCTSGKKDLHPYDLVRKMYDLDWDLSDIANKTGLPIGEVELVIKFKSGF